MLSVFKTSPTLWKAPHAGILSVFLNDWNLNLPDSSETVLTMVLTGDLPRRKIISPDETALCYIYTRMILGTGQMGCFKNYLALQLLSPVCEEG